MFTIQQRFEEFHKANPHVYQELVALCREAVSNGKDKLGVRMVWEVARWNLIVKTQQNSDFKLNDHYHSRYARLIMDQEQDLRGIFELRSLKA